MSIINATISGDSFGSLIHLDAAPVRQEVKRATLDVMAVAR